MITLPDNKTCLVKDIPRDALAWRNAPIINKWCRQVTDISSFSHSRWLEKIETDPTIEMYGILDKSKVMVQMLDLEIGVCGFTSINHINQSAEFSLYIAPKYQKKGFGADALRLLCNHGFKSMNLNRIWGEVFIGNPAMKIFQQLGFVLEGHLRQSYFKDGKFIDSEIISLLRGEACL